MPELQQPQPKRVALIHDSRCERGDHDLCDSLTPISPRTVAVCVCKCHKGTQLSLNLETPNDRR